MRRPISMAIVLAAGGVGAYVAVVARRIVAGYTHLGLDTICLVWMATSSLFALGSFRWVRAVGEEWKETIHMLSVIMPLLVLAAWAWLALTGRVISHGAMMEPR